MNRCNVVGILAEGLQSLTAHALQLVQEAELLIGGTRVLQEVTESLRSKAKATPAVFDITGKLQETPVVIQTALSNGIKVVVLASGDPLCHGIGGFLVRKLGKDQVEILPNLSTLQLATAKLGIANQKMKLISLHSKDTGPWVVNSGFSHGLYPLLKELQEQIEIAILTSPENTPSRIAQMLLLEGLQEVVSLFVLENIGLASEKIWENLSLGEAYEMEFQPLNIVILQSKGFPKKRFGRRDQEYLQRKPGKGLITKFEVRLASIGLLGLEPDSILWDIGAGSGSVGLEAATLVKDGFVFALEKNQDDYEIALQNKKNLQVYNYQLLHQKAPEGLENLPDPNAIFIGGTGGNLTQLIQISLQRLQAQGRLVMNFISIENLSTALETIKQSGYDWDLTQIQASRTKPILDMNRFAAEHPVFILSVTKA